MLSGWEVEWARQGDSSAPMNIGDRGGGEITRQTNETSIPRNEIWRELLVVLAAQKYKEFMEQDLLKIKNDASSLIIAAEDEQELNAIKLDLMGR